MLTIFAVAFIFVQEGPQPQAEHAWLEQFVGEWDFEAEMSMDPAKPPEKSKGTESVKMLGSFCLFHESRGEFMGKPFTGRFTLGYDPDSKKYIGSWIDSNSPYLYSYEGRLDESKKSLTLETEGPCPAMGGKVVKMRDTMEIVDDDHRVLTSKYLKDSEWVTGAKITFARRKS